MIKFGSPCDGWLDLHIDINSNWTTFSISDVGPNSVVQFSRVLDWLANPLDSYRVYCNLEPELLVLSFHLDSGFVTAEVELDALNLGRASMSVYDFHVMFSEEIHVLLPSCKGKAWTSEVNT
ncbi:hypothetical protein L4D06_16140 [Enterovibrio makurazakiensis]|uniref:Uncharacterized protein n=1 Tax=Enterovibrio gelatinilyticus TaxID=2899819 RepID=A0ABT5R848_9GAMM|nr:hypothetical protein [Enterovibrio sp. ZSDZ42]MDD1796448.1 hypothetical protein [Enterovibrio sp. ZSDZ42]